MKFGLLYEIALPRQVEATGKSESDVYFEALEQIRFAEELGGFDIDLDESKAMWDESVRLIPRMWTEHAFSGHEGRFVRIPPGRVLVPKPVQKPHPPTWMACRSPSSYETADFYGLGLLSFAAGLDSGLIENVKRYREALRAASPGGASETGERRPLSADLVAAGPDGLISTGTICVGDPARCAEIVGRYRDAGFDHYLALVQYGTLSHEESMASLRTFAEKVIPRFA